MVRTTITSKGQTTVPLGLRRLWKTSHIVWAENPDGSAIVRPAPDVMDLFGAAANETPRDPEEKEHAIAAVAAEAGKRKARR